MYSERTRKVMGVVIPVCYGLIIAISLLIPVACIIIIVVGLLAAIFQWGGP